MHKIILLVVLTALAGCNTVAGIGEDISGGANKVGNMMN
jgi:predicted small secreted protein